MQKDQIWENLLVAESKSRSGKANKFLRKPVLYPALMMFNKIWYPLIKRGVYVKTNVFFGETIRTCLPSGTDMILNGIKSHDSEIRLSKYLVRTLNPGDVFIDVGAHYGYYSLLAHSITGETGKVFSIEASASSFDDLKENVAGKSRIKIFHAAAGAEPGSITFYEYPGPYAEYNTTVQGAYTNEKWYRRVTEKVNTVPILPLDQVFQEEKIQRAFMKIDVEGGEASVLKGMLHALKENDLTIAMEYLSSNQKMGLHRQAAQILFDHGYRGHAINKEGIPERKSDIDRYLQEAGLDSDNIVFLK